MAFNYSPKVITNGLVLYLDAANSRSYPGTGTAWNDLSRSGYNGTLTNGPTFNSSNGGNIVFDGVDDYVSTLASLTVTEITMICYIRRNGNQSFYAGIFYSRKPDNSNAAGLDFRDNTQQLVYTWGNDPNTYLFVSNLTVPDNQWCMVGLSLNSTKADLYLNTSIATNNISHGSINISSGDLKVGLDSFSLSRCFKGNIALAMMYNRALTQAEILQNYNATKTRFGL